MARLVGQRRDDAKLSTVMMRFRGLLGLCGALFAGQVVAACDVTAWKFGMTPDEVAHVTECGPYRAFSNGDLETFKGEFAGSSERNFQFFFDHEQLRRIGIYLYEGNDPAAGAKAWRSLYQTMTALFGPIKTPGNVAPVEAAVGTDAFEATALELVQSSGKIQMAPREQPPDVFVFSSYIRRAQDGESSYYVVLYFDKRP